MHAKKKPIPMYQHFPNILIICPKNGRQRLLILKKCEKTGSNKVWPIPLWCQFTVDHDQCCVTLGSLQIKEPQITWGKSCWGEYCLCAEKWWQCVWAGLTGIHCRTKNEDSFTYLLSSWNCHEGHLIPVYFHVHITRHKWNLQFFEKKNMKN